MAEDQEQSQRTEEPTPKRLEEARKKGNVANSREVSTWFMLAASTALLGLMGPSLGHDLSVALARYLELAHAIDAEAPVALLYGLGREFGPILAMPALALVVAALASGVVQQGILFASDRIKPEWSRISPLAGFKRMFSLRASVDLVKGVLKIALIAAIVWSVALPTLERLAVAPEQPLETATTDLIAVLLRLLIATTVALAVVAGTDFFYQRYEHMRKLRMTRQEVRDELKQTEGDPHVRARLRAIRTERARRRMMQAVPEAAVVITNPTHYAVALAYESGTMAAPAVVAKGADLVAQRIRAVAEEHKVPIVENAPLARALFGAVEIGDAIPAEHYQAVAQIVAYVYRLKGRPAKPATR